MDSGRVLSKKLTNAGGASCAFAAIAMFISAVGVFQYFIMEMVYDRYFDDARLFVNDLEWTEFLITYGDSIAFVLISFIALCVFIANKNTKRLGAEFGGLLSIASVALMVKVATVVYYLIDNDIIEDAINSDSDNLLFSAIMQLLVYAIPLVAGFFLLIAGLIILIKACGEKFTAACPVVEKQSYSAPQNTQTMANNSYNAQENFAGATQSTPLSPVVKQPDAIIPETPCCKKCGRQLFDNERFCKECGTPVK